MRLDLITVGDVMLDVVVDELFSGRRLHAPVRARAGGSAANAATWAAAAGAEAAVVGRIGRDPAGHAVRAALAEAGVQTLFAFDDELPTGISVAVSDVTAVTERGANAGLSPDDIGDPLEARAVLVSGYALLQPDSEAAGLAALERARCDWLAVDGAAAGLLARYGPGRFFSATERAGILLVNEAEARVLVEGDPAVAAEELGKRYAIACVKLGPAGVVASVRGDLVHVPSSEVEARNTVGCGDAFAAGLLGALARGDEPDRALVEACRLGALAAESTAWPPVAQRIS